MPYSIVDFEKVDNSLFGIINMLNSLQNMISGPAAPPSNNIANLINAIDLYRNDVGCEIEKQGAR